MFFCFFVFFMRKHGMEKEEDSIICDLIGHRFITYDETLFSSNGRLSEVLEGDFAFGDCARGIEASCFDSKWMKRHCHKK